MTGLEILFVHGLCDFPAQPGWMARRKLTDWRVRSLHVAVHGVAFAVAAFWVGHSAQVALMFAAAVAVAHYVIDCRRWLGSDWAPGAIINDQVLHLGALAVLARLMLGGAA